MELSERQPACETRYTAWLKLYTAAVALMAAAVNAVPAVSVDPIQLVAVDTGRDMHISAQTFTMHELLGAVHGVHWLWLFLPAALFAFRESRLGPERFDRPGCHAAVIGAGVGHVAAWYHLAHYGVAGVYPLFRYGGASMVADHYETVHRGRALAEVSSDGELAGRYGPYVTVEGGWWFAGAVALAALAYACLLKAYGEPGPESEAERDRQGRLRRRGRGP